MIAPVPRVHIEALTFREEAGPFNAWCACPSCFHASPRWCEAKGCPCCTEGGAR